MGILGGNFLQVFNYEIMIFNFDFQWKIIQMNLINCCTSKCFTNLNLVFALDIINNKILSPNRKYRYHNQF